MNISTLPKIVKKSKKRLGRGHGSGKVKTSGRGTEGQKARGTIPVGFEGGQLSIIKRLPLLRGKGKNKSKKRVTQTIYLAKLSVFSSGAIVTMESLRKHNIITKETKRVKIIGSGRIDKALTIVVPCSKGSQKAIEKAGGTVKK